MEIKRGWGRITFGGPGIFELHNGSEDGPVTVLGPVLELDGERVGHGGWDSTGILSDTEIHSGGREIRAGYVSRDRGGVRLTVVMRVFEGTPVVRFSYLIAADGAVMTKSGGRDELTYFTASHPCPALGFADIQFAQFERTVHSYMPHMQPREAWELREGITMAGPIAVWGNDGTHALAAYEHGCDHPESFLTLGAKAVADGIELTVRAKKGNYWSGRTITEDTPFESVWFQLALVQGGREDLLKAYRSFFLGYMSGNTESRKPYIFYNTWNHQERNKYFKGVPYLTDMHQERMLAEIDKAHAMGIDVFVIDTGWYGKTGDWLVNLERFPDNLKAVRERLEGYGMKLGLWFDPNAAAKTSEIVVNHPEYIREWNGEKSFRGEVWETEESWAICMASGYTDWFIDKLASLYHELGVRYFKWDAIGQYGCDSPDHWHGGPENSRGERADCYAFEMSKHMIRIVRELTERCPEAIVDFDITENGRNVGLGFLAVGKYFLVNNGPYFHEFDIPKAVKMEPDTINVFFYPGAARPRVCRHGSKFDAVVPSILFLTHYLPDGPRLSQENSLASLVLGGNGIWGDLVSLTDDDVAWWSENLANYKRVADAVTRSYPRVRGFIGSSPEIHEKLDPESGCGVVVFLSHLGATVRHMTQPVARVTRVIGADEWSQDADGCLTLTVNLGADGARTVFVSND